MKTEGLPFFRMAVPRRRVSSLQFGARLAPIKPIKLAPFKTGANTERASPKQTKAGRQADARIHRVQCQRSHRRVVGAA